MVIIAFDIMLAGSVVVLFAALYFQDANGNPKCKPRAAFWALNMGSLSRLIFQFALPHDYMYLIGGSASRESPPTQRSPCLLSRRPTCACASRLPQSAEKVLNELRASHREVRGRDSNSGRLTRALID